MYKCLELIDRSIMPYIWIINEAFRLCIEPIDLSMVPFLMSLDPEVNVKPCSGRPYDYASFLLEMIDVEMVGGDGIKPYLNF